MLGVDVLCCLRHAAHARHLVQHGAHAANVFHLLKLLSKILQIETATFLYLAGELFGLAMIDLPLHFLDERQHVAHAQNARGESVRVERVQRIGLFTHPQKLDRPLGDRAHGKRCTAAGIRVDLGEYDARQRQGFAEGLSGVGRVLTGHGVDHKQGLDGIHGLMQRFDLGHHFLIDRQTTGGIHEQDIRKCHFGVCNRPLHNVDGLLFGMAGFEPRAHLCRQRLQLGDRRRTIDVSTDDRHFFLLPLNQVTRQLGHRGGFTCTLKTGDHHHRRWLGGEIQPFRLAPHYSLKLGLHNF